MRPLLLPALALSILALSGCGKGDAPADGASSTAPTADAPSAAPGMMLSDAVIRLPAVSGNPGVAYFTLSQGDGAPRKLVAVHVDGFAKAEMHQTVDEAGMMSMRAVSQVPIEAGKAIEFKPGGYHVMLFDADGTLKAGGDTELTITLDNGDKASVRAKVEAAGGDDMGHMDHM